MSSLNIYQRIALVQSKVPYVPKDGKMEGVAKYDYAKESDFLRILRPLLTEAGIAVTFTMEGEPVETAIISKSGTAGLFVRTTLVMTLVNVDKPAEMVVSRLRGDATDYGDKAIYKSFTGAKKYLLSLAFLVATGDDPEDKDVPEHKHVGATRQRGRMTEERYPDSPPPPKNKTRFEELEKNLKKADNLVELKVHFAYVVDARRNGEINEEEVAQLTKLKDVRKAILGGGTTGEKKTEPQPEQQPVTSLFDPDQEVEDAEMH